MKADIRWLDDPQVFRVNRLDAHSDHKFYENKEDYEKKEQRLKQSLNGIWKFRYSENAMERPADFYQKWFQCRSFDEMKVPQHIELAGYDQIHYINTMYPWEGKIYRPWPRPPSIMIRSGSRSKPLSSWMPRRKRRLKTSFILA